MNAILQQNVEFRVSKLSTHFDKDYTFFSRNTFSVHIVNI